jgi:hypothetical protein
MRQVATSTIDRFDRSIRAENVVSAPARFWSEIAKSGQAAVKFDAGDAR